MPVEFSQDSAYAKEMRKWEAHHSRFGAPGRPYVFREFPKRLYKAERTDRGPAITESVEVQTADEERNYLSRGFRFGQDHALALLDEEQAIHGALAAEREYDIQHGKLSDRAVAEVRAEEHAHGATHMPAMPEAPRRGRKPKAQEH